jgi:hypothetical protein
MPDPGGRGQLCRKRKSCPENVEGVGRQPEGSNQSQYLEEDWDSAPLDEQIETYQFLRARVDKHKREGFTTRW